MASNCWDDNREKVCRSCDSQYYKKLNTCCEQSFYRIGVVTAIYAPAILVFFVVFFGGLGLGIYEADLRNDLYYLWIEKGSRLHGERAYTDEHHSGGETRNSFQIYTNPDYTSNALNRKDMPYIFDTVYGGLNVTGTDADLGEITWHDVCDRYPTPPSAIGLMRYAGAKGFPCNKFSTTDCFSEGMFGDWGYDLPNGVLTFAAQNAFGAPGSYIGQGCCSGPIQILIPSTLADWRNFTNTNIASCITTCAGLQACVAFDYAPNGNCTFYTAVPQLTFNVAFIRTSTQPGATCPFTNYTRCWIKNSFPLINKYLFQKSYQSLTDNDILQIAGTPRACATYIGAQPPENFLFGGLVRSNSSDTAAVVKIPTTEVFIFVKSFQQYAKTKCINKCVAANQCRETLLAKMADLGTQNPGNPGSCQAAAVAKSTSCFDPAKGECMTNDTWTMAWVQKPAAAVAGAFNQKFALYCGGLGGCTSDPKPPLCGSCGAWLAAGNLSAPRPPLCTACGSYAATTVPIVSSCLQQCGTSTGSACAQGAIGAATICELNCTKFCAVPTDEELDVAADAIMGWESNFVDYMAKKADDKTGPYKVDYFTERSVDDLVNAAGAADSKLIVIGYIAMVAFGCLTLFQWDGLQSRLMLGFVGMILVILSIVASLGFTAIVQIPFVPTIVQVLPFLALGLGTYDMFVLAFNFNYVPEKTIPAMLGELMKECGPRLLLTACTNIIVFGIGANIPLSAVNLFSGAMCIVILFNFLILVFGFGALIALNAERMRKNKVDCLCCFNARYKSQSISTEKAHQIGAVPLAFAKFMFYKPTQLFVLAASIVIFGVAMWGATLVEIGLPLQDIVPQDFYAYGFLKARTTFYTSGTLFLTTGYRGGESAQLDHMDPVFFRDMIELENQIQTVEHTDPKMPIWGTSWLDTFLYYCATSAPIAGLPPCARASTATDPQIKVYGLNQSTGKPVMFDSRATPVFPNKPFAAAYLQAFLGASGLANVQYLELDANYTILSSRIPFFQVGLQTDQQVVDYIVATRKYTDACPQLVYPAGLQYDLYEQYVKTREYLGTNLGYTCIGVLLITSLFLFHPGAVLIMFFLIVLTVAEIFGFLAFFNLKLNGVSSVNMIMAIGVVVAPVAHITRVFMVSHGTNSARAEHALAMMTFPMLFSTISTFVGEFPMEFARFPYFRLYFFYQYVIIGVITIVNAFLPLPLLLAYFGPPPLIEEGGSSGEKAQAYEKGGLVEIPGLEDSTVTGRTDG